jgi:uncharacterized protein YegP (UPF0339 family)
MRTPKFIIYRDKKSEYRWQLRASNGRIIAESGEGYKRKRSIIKLIQRKFETSESDLELVICNALIIDKTKP